MCRYELRRDFMASEAGMLTTRIRGAGFTIGLLMGFGAVFGALNTMYSAVASRAREIATLRALGFGPMAIFVSVLTEALALALAGGTLGGACAYLAFNGYQASTLNYQSFTQVTFAFAVTPGLLMSGIGYALMLGAFGGALPAWRAVREPTLLACARLNKPLLNNERVNVGGGMRRACMTQCWRCPSSEVWSSAVAAEQQNYAIWLRACKFMHTRRRQSNAHRHCGAHAIAIADD